MQEQAGRPFMGTAAEALKKRVSTLNDLKGLVGTLDVEDENTFAAYLTNEAAMFMAQSTQLPNLAHCMTMLLLEILRQADEIGDPMVKLSTRMAVAKAFQQNMDGETGAVTMEPATDEYKQEVTEDENDQS